METKQTQNKSLSRIWREKAHELQRSLELPWSEEGWGSGQQVARVRPRWVQGQEDLCVRLEIKHTRDQHSYGYYINHTNC